jgi:hypothetical protein
MKKQAGGSVSNSGTQLLGGDAAGSRSRAFQFGGASPNNWFGVNFSFLFLDAANTTSEVSYRLCHLGRDANSNIYLGRTGRDTDNTEHPRTSTQIVLMEVASGVL